MRYQIGTWLPWFIKRYVFWNKGAVLKPLYHFEEVHGPSEPAPETKESREIQTEQTEDTKAVNP